MLIVTHKGDFTTHDLVGTHSARKPLIRWRGEFHPFYMCGSYAEIRIDEICFGAPPFSLSFMQAFYKSLPERMNRKQK